MAIEASDVPSARQADQSFNPPLVGMVVETPAVWRRLDEILMFFQPTLVGMVVETRLSLNPYLH